MLVFLEVNASEGSKQDGKLFLSARRGILLLAFLSGLWIGMVWRRRIGAMIARSSGIDSCASLGGILLCTFFRLLLVGFILLGMIWVAYSYGLD